MMYIFPHESLPGGDSGGGARCYRQRQVQGQPIFLVRGLCICIYFDVGCSAVGGIFRRRARREADRYAAGNGWWW